ncbi:MAG TPA: type IV pilin protein [Rhodopila sp.]
MKREYRRMSTQIQPRTATMAGFTLIELMIAVAVVGILATIAATSYQGQLQRSRRTDARSALLDLAGREEKLYSTTNAYSQAASDLGYAPFTQPVGSGFYTVSVAVPNPPISYVITATAINAQAADTACATLTVDQTGAQGSTGSGTPAACWGR